MKKLLLSALISTALFSNIAFAETYFECTDISGSQFRLTDSEKGKDFLTYQETNKNGERYQFNLQKSDINFGTDSGQDTNGEIYDIQYAHFESDKARYEMHYTKFSDILEHAYVTAILFGEEDIDDKGYHHCNMAKPIIHSLDKLNPANDDK